MKVISGLLNGAELETLRAIAGEARFEAGAETAGSAIREKKQNQQAVLTGKHRQLIDQTVRGAARRSKLLGLYAHPRTIGQPILSRYREGDFYARHLDQPLMGIEEPFRADLSMTIFLSDPKSYTGGELIVELETGEAKLKLPAGTAVLYPASHWHRVAVVGSGERLALVTWVQSYVADPTRRAMLAELGEAFDTLVRIGATDPLNIEVRDKVQRSYTSLLRLWSEV